MRSTIITAMLLAIVLQANAAVVLNQITGVTSKNLMYTGTIEVGTEKLFFTFYGVDGETNPDSLSAKPLVISVGTPGRSAQYANLAGLGPKTLEEMKLVDNTNSLTSFASILFLDSLGSGFSFASSPSAIPKSMYDHGTILTAAINSFTSETNVGSSKSIYLIGESTWIRAVEGMSDVKNVKGVLFLAPWFDFYELGSYYGSAGMDLKLFTYSEKITIDATFEDCQIQQLKSKYAQAHSCYDITLNYIQSKTKTTNLYNIKSPTPFPQHLSMIQFYFSQASTTAIFKAPESPPFQSQSSLTYSQIYQDQGNNIDSHISSYIVRNKDPQLVFIVGDNDFICYRKAVKFWLENSLVFTESQQFRPISLKEFFVDGQLVGYMKGVKHVAYYELINSGHFVYHDQPSVLKNILLGLINGNGEETKNIRGGAAEHEEHHHTISQISEE